MQLSINVEIVVVDTGSTDHTREIACRYTDHVYDFTWCDDFATAKKYVISKVHGHTCIPKGGGID